MEGVGAEVRQKIKCAIKAKLMEIGVYVDEELPEYVMVMVANKRSKDEMDDELQLFLGQHTLLFTAWLHQVLQKLQEVTVATSGCFKTTLPEASKKKKKSKQDIEKKEPKKRRQREAADDMKELPKTKVGNKMKRDSIIEENSDALYSNQHDDIKFKRIKKSNEEKVKEGKHISKNNRELEMCMSNTYIHQKSDTAAAGSKSRSILSQPEDLDYEDCINIRTDGELLDAAEDVNTEEASNKSRDKSESISSKNREKDTEEKRITLRSSPIRQKNKSKSSDHSNVERLSEKETFTKQPSPHQSPPHSDDKVIDARVLLNRKKAAKHSDTRARTRSKERSVSPPRKRRDDVKIYHGDRDISRKTLRENERESSSRRILREDERDKRSLRERDSHSLKHRGEDRQSRRTDSDRMDSRDSRKRDSSSEPLHKRVLLDRSLRNKSDDWNSARSSENRKMEIEVSSKRRELEEGRKRSMLMSQVIPRPLEPEDDVETPVPSVVKVTPRPRRPPSHQPSSTLIMKAISEANKSLANVPQRPDSTQEDAREGEDEVVSPIEAVKALNTAIRYIKQTNQSVADVAVFIKWRKQALSALNES